MMIGKSGSLRHRVTHQSSNEFLLFEDLYLLVLAVKHLSTEIESRTPWHNRLNASQTRAPLPMWKLEHQKLPSDHPVFLNGPYHQISQQAMLSKLDTTVPHYFNSGRLDIMSHYVYLTCIILRCSYIVNC